MSIIVTPEHNIPALALKAAADYPDNVAFHYFRSGWNTVTYTEFADEVLAVASHLISSGLKPDERVAIISENRHEWCAVYLAITMAGGISVPLDTQLGPEEVRNLLTDAEAKVIFCSDITYSKVAALGKNTFSGKQNGPRLLNVDSLEYHAARRSRPLQIFPERTPEDIASIIYTSGTTGKPKGVMLTHRNFCSDAEALITAGIVSHRDNVLSVLPLHHTYAFMCTFLVPVFLGASITYPASLKGPDLMEAMKDRGVSILIGVPQLLGLIRNGIRQKILSLPKPLSLVLLWLHRTCGLLRRQYDINIGRIIFRSAHEALGKKFRFFASGGAKLDPEIMKDLEAFGFSVLEGYGLTETSPVVTFNPFSLRKPGSAGKALPSVELVILDASETGEGEIAIRGPMVMRGYYQNPSATTEALRDGWFRTGDIGMLDRDGYLFITGRSKEVIVLSSGKNIYPEDVEKLYAGSPLIKELCILGKGERGLTESLHAVIVPDLDYAKKMQIANIQEAIKWAINEMSGRVPGSMRITGFSLRSEPLPRTPLGKLRRFMISAGLVQPTEGKTAKTGGADILPSDITSGRVKEVLHHFVKKGQGIRMEDNLELDIGLDSLSKVELVVGLEKALALKLSEDFISDVQTVQDLVDKLKKYELRRYTPAAAEKTGWKHILMAGQSVQDPGLISLQKPESAMISARLGHAFLRTLFRLYFGLRVRGVEHIPSDSNFILAPNHTSYLDGAALLLSLPFSAFRNIYTLGLSEFFTGFFKSRFARIAHVIPIDSAAYLGKALQTSAYVLGNKWSLSVFPEGGRSFDGNLMEFKKGVGILAVEMEVPVVPVYISGTFEALPREARFPKPGNITVTFGRPVRAKDIDFSQRPQGSDEYQHFAEILRERVRRLKTGEPEPSTDMV